MRGSSTQVAPDTFPTDAIRQPKIIPTRILDLRCVEAVQLSLVSASVCVAANLKLVEI